MAKDCGVLRTDRKNEDQLPSLSLRNRCAHRLWQSQTVGLYALSTSYTRLPRPRWGLAMTGKGSLYAVGSSCTLPADSRPYGVNCEFSCSILLNLKLYKAASSVAVGHDDSACRPRSGRQYRRTSLYAVGSSFTGRLIAAPTAWSAKFLVGAAISRPRLESARSAPQSFTLSPSSSLSLDAAEV